MTIKIKKELVSIQELKVGDYFLDTDELDNNSWYIRQVALCESFKDYNNREHIIVYYNLTDTLKEIIKNGFNLKFYITTHCLFFPNRKVVKLIFEEIREKINYII